MPAARKRAGWILLAAVALAARVAAVWVLHAEHAAPVTYEHGAIAENLLAGRGFSIWFLGSDGPTSQQAPLYPLLLAGAYALWGTHSREALLAVQLLQCLAGTVTVLAVVWLTRSVAGRRPAAAWWAGWCAALFPAHVYLATQIQVVGWAAMVLVLLAAVVYEPRWQGRMSAALAAGVLAGLLLLVEPILALALPWFWWVVVRGARQPGTWRGTLVPATVMPLAALVLIAPWTLRNRAVHGEWMFVKSTFGYAFWQGNNPSSWGTDKIPKPEVEALRQAHDGTLADAHRALWEARHKTLYIDDVLIKPHGYGRFAGLTEPQRSRLLGGEAWAFITQRPQDYARLCLARLRYFLLFDPTNPKAAHPWYRWPGLAWLALLTLGLWLMPAAAWRSAWPLAAAPASVTLFHALVITSARFRMPLEPIGLVWVGMALAALTANLAHRAAGLARWIEGLRPRGAPSTSSRA